MRDEARQTEDKQRRTEAQLTEELDKNKSTSSKLQYCNDKVAEQEVFGLRRALELNLPLSPSSPHNRKS